MKGLAQSAAVAWCLQLCVLIGIAVLGGAMATRPAQAEGRLALVIGNSQYQYVPQLAQPANDAAAVAAELRRLGFGVVEGQDLSRDRFLLLVSDFRSRIKSENAQDVVFYYSGHAFNMFGQNLIVPADAQLTSRNLMQSETIRFDDILSQIQVSDTQKTVFLLDSSRAAPLPEAMQGEDSGSGLVQIETTNETAGALLIFATLPNQVTDADEGPSSPFTQALLKHMGTPGKDIDTIFTRIRKDVIAITDGRQKPFKQGSPSELFFFNPGTGEAEPQVAETAPQQDEATPPVIDPVDPGGADVIYGTETSDTQQPVTETPVTETPVTETPVTETPVTESPATPAGTFRDCGAPCPVMVAIVGGTFTMGNAAGDAAQKPAHSVTVSAFALGQQEVSIGEWRNCVADEKCRDLGKAQAANSGDTPVYNVTWDDAVAYAGWLSGVSGKAYRLPTEAEWEYAARAGTGFAFSGSEEPSPDYMDCKTCGKVVKHAVPRARDLRPNAFGLSGMSGGVAEWVADCWVPNYGKHPADGSAAEVPNCSRRVLRGGSWRDDAKNVTVSSRAYYDKDVPYPNNGFRIAREMP